MNTKEALLGIALGLSAGCYVGSEGLGEEIDGGRGNNATFTTGRTSSTSGTTYKCDKPRNESAEAAPDLAVGAMPAAFPPNNPPPNNAPPINVQPYLADLIEGCAGDPEVQLECEDLCMMNGYAWMPGGTVGIDPQSIEIVVGEWTPAGWCEGGTEVVAEVDLTADCVCNCGAPLLPQ